jgi:hypothetical protein
MKKTVLQKLTESRLGEAPQGKKRPMINLIGEDAKAVPRARWGQQVKLAVDATVTGTRMSKTQKPEVSLRIDRVRGK